ncbi:hypothetical protein M8C21_004503, partial [Ambrosia artemisiifolia]
INRLKSLEINCVASLAKFKRTQFQQIILALDNTSVLHYLIEASRNIGLDISKQDSTKQAEHGCLTKFNGDLGWSVVAVKRADVRQGQ